MHINKPFPPEWVGRKSISAAEYKDFVAGKDVRSGTHPRGTSGKREDLGNTYFRSSMEANIARYYNFLGIEWQYEPCEFEFPIKRGIRFYKPDFYLPATDTYIECKGWMDAKSKTKLKRMEKYHPDVKLQLLLWHEYTEIARQVSRLIPNWEVDRR